MRNTTPIHTSPSTHSGSSVTALLAQRSALCTNDQQRDMVLQSLQASLATAAVEHLLAQAYPARLGEYGGHLIAVVPTVTGADIGLDPLGECHWATLEDCLDPETSINPEIWHTISFTDEGHVRDVH